MQDPRTPENEEFTPQGMIVLSEFFYSGNTNPKDHTTVIPRINTAN